MSSFKNKFALKLLTVENIRINNNLFILLYWADLKINPKILMKIQISNFIDMQYAILEIFKNICFSYLNIFKNL
jgi:hypothetical protein